MKTENFDDAIRGKIESINPQFDEKDIDKVHSYVAKKRSSVFQWSNRNIVLASLLLVSIAGLLTWNFSQKEERNQLVQTIDSLRKNLVITKNQVPVVKIDTVYITQQVNESKSNVAKAHTQPKQNVNEIEVPLTMRHKYASQNKTAGIKLNLKEKLISKNESFVNQTMASAATSERKEDNAIDSSSNVTQAFNSNSASVANENDGKNNISTTKPNQIPNDSGNNNLTKPENSIPSGDQAAVSLPVTQGASDTSASDKRKPQNYFHFLNNIHYQIGAGFEIANASTGYSINGEALLNNKWSVSIGVQLVQLGNEIFDDDDDFHHKKGKDFSHVYPSDVTDTSSNSNIHIHTTLIRIPVKLNYHVALKHNYSLVFAAGTDIDVYAMQTIGYHHNDNINPDIPKNFNATPSTLLFNNITISAGIQKEWRRFVFRAEPFVSPQITDVEYKNDTFYFGLGLKVLYVI